MVPGLLHGWSLFFSFKTRPYWSPTLVCVVIFLQYPFVLISNTRLCCYLSSILVRIDIQHSFVLLPSFDTRPYWSSTPVHVGLDLQHSFVLMISSNNRQYWVTTLVRVDPSFLNLSSTLVRVDPFSNTHPCWCRIFNTCPYWASTLVRVGPFLVLVCIDLQHSSMLVFFFNTRSYWSPVKSPSFDTRMCWPSFFNTCPYWS